MSLSQHALGARRTQAKQWGLMARLALCRLSRGKVLRSSALRQIKEEHRRASSVLRLFLPFDHAENGRYKRRLFTACEREPLFLKVHRP